MTGGNLHYRRAILRSLEGLHDYESRSNISLVRKHTRCIIEEEEHENFSDILFLHTLKAISKEGTVEQMTHSFAQLSPETKSKRVKSLAHRIEIAMEAATKEAHPEIPILPPAHIHLYPRKEAPKRKDEHEKWKIVPNKIYEHERYVTQMHIVSESLG